MAKKEVNLFKLDTNIDGTYVDENGEVVTIENMIQVVNATDGPEGYPANKSRTASFTEDELLTFKNDPFPFEVTKQRNNYGHGVFYDADGKPYAFKGDLVLRDGQGNSGNLAKIFGKVSTILEEGDNVFLRDHTLQEFNNSDTGVDLNDLITAAKQKIGSFGGGNIVQATSNKEVNDKKITLYTVELTDLNYVWIFGSVVVENDTMVRIKDLTTDTILDTAYLVPEKADIITPLYVSWVGRLPTIQNPENAPLNCDSIVWNSFLKRHFILDPNANVQFGIHEIVIETFSDACMTKQKRFLRGSLNMVCFDDVSRFDEIKTGNFILNGTEETTVSFENEFINNNYSLGIQTETVTRFWYDSKQPNEFTIKFERPYTGFVFWIATLKGGGVGTSIGIGTGETEYGDHGGTAYMYSPIEPCETNDNNDSFQSGTIYLPDVQSFRINFETPLDFTSNASFTCGDDNTQGTYPLTLDFGDDTILYEVIDKKCNGATVILNTKFKGNVSFVAGTETSTEEGLIRRSGEIEVISAAYTTIVFSEPMPNSSYGISVILLTGDTIVYNSDTGQGTELIALNDITENGLTVIYGDGDFSGTLRYEVTDTPDILNR